MIRKDAELDLAILKTTDAKSAPLSLGADETVGELQQVLAFGFPFGKDLALNPGDYPSISINTGRITALRKKSGKLNRIQVDAVVNPGNSGGPLMDKNGRVIGVVVSGILGAGAVNFAIPVSHVKQFLSSPTIEFIPPAVTRQNQHEMLDFKATALASPLSPGAVELELVLTSVTGEERRFEMKMFNGAYAIRAVPIALSKRTNSARVEAKFSDAIVTANCEDKEIKIGEKIVKLSEIKSYRPGTKGGVVLKDGTSFPGPAIKLDSISARIGGVPVILNLAALSELTVIQLEEQSSVGCVIIARQGGKEVGRHETTLYVDGIVPIAAANGGDAVPAVASSNNGKASLEAIIEGTFNRPNRSGARTGYMKVLSTAGDYIGGGKRYEYTAKDMVVQASEGLVRITVDGWDVNISPGKGKLLKVGEYSKAKRYPFNDTMPGFSFSGNGRGSNTLAAKFVVWEFVMQGTEVKSMAIDFVQNSEERGPPLVGMFRYNSLFE